MSLYGPSFPAFCLLVVSNFKWQFFMSSFTCIVFGLRLISVFLGLSLKVFLPVAIQQSAYLQFLIFSQLTFYFQILIPFG